MKLLTSQSIRASNVDSFHWLYSRRNRWYYETKKAFPSLSLLARCKEKVQTEIALLTFKLSRSEVEVYQWAVKNNMVDHIAFVGKLADNIRILAQAKVSCCS